MAAYYNEIDPYAAAWLRELISAGHIADGVVDTRSIVEVEPNDLREFTQCHFFAGIGVWSYALRNAGWSDDRPVWTGSCPCQPFSTAGKGAGFDDERHLWPAFHHLIEQCRPPVVFGEQVASKDGLTWIELVQADLEGSSYATGAVDLCAAGVGAPHIRQRLYWVGVGQADANLKGLEGRRGMLERATECAARSGDVAGGLADTNENGCQQRVGVRPFCQEHDPEHGECSGGLADASSLRQHERRGTESLEIQGHGTERSGEYAQPGSNGQLSGRSEGLCGPHRTGPTNGFWRDADWLYCRDGRWRSVKPGTFALVDRTPRGMVPSSGTGLPINADKTGEGRVMRLKGYGNAICAPLAQEFISAYMGLGNDPT